MKLKTRDIVIWVSVASVSIALIISFFLLTSKGKEEEARDWNRGKYSDVCPEKDGRGIPVCCEQMNKTQCDEAEHSVNAINKKWDSVKWFEFHGFSDCKKMASDWGFKRYVILKGPSFTKDSLGKIVNTTPEMCNARYTSEGDREQVNRYPAFSQPTTHFVIDLCFNKVDAACIQRVTAKNKEDKETLEAICSMGNPKLIKAKAGAIVFDPAPGYRGMITHALIHVYMGGTSHNNYFHPRFCDNGLMCKKPGYTSIGHVTDTVMKRIARQCLSK